MVAEMLQKYIFIFNIFYFLSKIYLYSIKKKKKNSVVRILSFKENIFMFNQNILVFKIFSYSIGFFFV